MLRRNSQVIGNQINDDVAGTPCYQEIEGKRDEKDGQITMERGQRIELASAQARRRA
jgi:hypothetical protein